MTAAVKNVYLLFCLIFSLGITFCIDHVIINSCYEGERVNLNAAENCVTIGDIKNDKISTGNVN